MTSLRLGAMTADASDDQLDALTRYGYSLGLAFQAIDDTLDVTQTTKDLGKTAGKDQAVNKATYPSVWGLDAARKEAERLTQEALSALEPLGENGDRLKEIADWMLLRKY